MDKMKFPSACKAFFGLRPGETLIEFAQELKALTQEDRAELAPLLGKALGVEVEL